MGSTDAVFGGGAATFTCVWTAHVLLGDTPGPMAKQAGAAEASERPLPAQCSVSQSQLLSHREVSRSLDLLYVYLIVHL